MYSQYVAALDHIADLRAEAQAARQVAALLADQRPRHRRSRRARRRADAAGPPEVSRRRAAAET